MKSSKTTYVPVRYDGHKYSPTAATTAAAATKFNHNRQREDFPNIDDDDEDQDERRLSGAANNRHQQQQPSDTNQEDEDAESLEEVYLCNCCGVTRELDPAMKYMPLFRTLFFLVNFFVFAFGLANLGMGLWFRIDPKVYEIHKYVETQNFTIAGWIMLFGGFLACLMSLIGCMATARQSIGGLMCYITIIGILTCSFIGTIVLLTVFGLGKQLENFLTKEIYEQIRRRTMNTELDLFVNSDAAQFLDFVQVKMRCCGAVDFRDYQKLGMVIPTTCYTIAGNYINAPGCGRAIRELFDIRAGLATGFTTGSVIVQLAAIVLAASMVCSIYHWRANPRPARTKTPTPTNPAQTTSRRIPADELNDFQQLQQQQHTHSKQFEPVATTSRGSSAINLHSIRI